MLARYGHSDSDLVHSAKHSPRPIGPSTWGIERSPSTAPLCPPTGFVSDPASQGRAALPARAAALSRQPPRHLRRGTAQGRYPAGQAHPRQRCSAGQIIRRVVVSWAVTSREATPARLVGCAPASPSWQYAPSGERYTLYSSSPRIIPWLTRRWKGSGVETAPMSYSTCFRRSWGFKGIVRVILVQPGQKQARSG